jgi:hypothetical protein
MASEPQLANPVRCHGAKISSVPANPSSSPLRRIGWMLRSVPMTMPISSDHNGVVAFSTPATPESTVCSPMLNRANGNALHRSAATTT